MSLMASRESVAAGASQFDTTTGLLVFYYATLGFFLLVCLFVLGSFFFRAVFEHSVIASGQPAEHSRFSSVCSVKVLQISLWTAFGLLAGLFVAFWLFWGNLLEELSWRMQAVIQRLAAKLSDDIVKALGDAANRTFTVVVFFVLCISLNVLVLMRQLLNKTVLLKTNNRGSLFRLMHVNLTDVMSSPAVFRQLWMSFLFDVLELWTLATWSLYPIFVAVFWVSESSCINSKLVVVTADSLTPLIGCMFDSRYHLLVVCVGWLGVVTGCTILYVLRFLDERRFLRGSENSRWWHLGPFVLMSCLLFWAGSAAAILSLIMMGKPFLSSRVNNLEDRLYLAAPGLVLFCGNVLLLFHIGRKLAAAVAFRTNHKTSFFFERGVPLSDLPLPQSYELESTSPYFRIEDDILY